MAEFKIHIEPEANRIYWWAETDAIENYTAWAGSLVELRGLIDEGVRLYLPAGTDIQLTLVGPESSATATGPAAVHRDGPEVSDQVGVPATLAFPLQYAV